jgi:uncharacterized membrane protein
MDVQPDFEGELRARIGRLESEVSALAGRMDNMSASTAPSGGARGPTVNPVDDPRLAASARRVEPKPHATSSKRFSEPMPSRGADWWLARAGAALTVLALILLYQYAVGHGWITPVVRVMTGAAVGGALMYWGRKLAPAANDAAFPVALRELMMGSGLAAWYVTAYAASVLYYLISVPTARFIFLILSIVGGLIALNERRALLAIIAIGTGFATPALLSSSMGSIPAYVLFLAVLGGLSVYLYLMRGWQSILWISLFSMWGSVDGAIIMTASRVSPGPLSLFDSGRVSLALLIVAMTYAFVRAPVLRRKLLATGSDRYAEPIRSTFAQNWLREMGRFLKLFSPHAGAADSLSIWIITIAAPLIGISLLSFDWKLSSYLWGSLAIAAAAIAFQRFNSAGDGDGEVKDVFCAATIVWSLAGFLSIGREVAHFAAFDANAFSLGIVAVYSMLIVTFLSPPRFVAAVAVGRSLAGLAIAAVVFTELSVLGTGRTEPQVALTMAFAVAEILSIGAAFIAAREMSKRIATTEVVVAFALSGYAAFLLVDARVLGAVWSPLVTATYAIAGTALLIRGRASESKIMQRAGGATIALVIGRLLFVDLIGVDTIWRVLLFLGCGALFLFTSHQIQNAAKQTPPGVE